MNKAKRKSCYHILPSVFLAIFLIVGCSASNVSTKTLTTQSINKMSDWAILPIANYSESPFAGEKVENIIEALLRMKGIRSVSKYPKLELPGEIPILDNDIRFQQGLEWAKSNKYKYCIYGSIEEWRYKSGVDRKPVVGFTLHIKDLNTGTVYWTGTGSKAGRGKESVSGVAKDLLSEMLARDM
jgi:PBP1b-binding outer membrane lipoprotein LpoB